MQRFAEARKSIVPPVQVKQMGGSMQRFAEARKSIEKGFFCCFDDLVKSNYCVQENYQTQATYQKSSKSR